MTPEQIRQIAEEYAGLNPPCTDDEKLRQDGICLNAAMVFEPFLRFLNDRYCIVEREKVVEMYNSLKVPNYPCVDPKPTGVASIVLRDLFGASMFNQNEE